MKRLLLAGTLLVCALNPAYAGQIDGTGKTPPPPPPPCTENCTQSTAPDGSVSDVITLEFVEVIIGLLAAR
jgi:hypothetical protein